MFFFSLYPISVILCSRLLSNINNPLSLPEMSVGSTFQKNELMNYRTLIWPTTNSANAIELVSPGDSIPIIYVGSKSLSNK